MKRSSELYINDVLDSIAKIESFSKNLSKKKLSTDDLHQSAIIRQIEVIGEAVKNLPIDFISRYPEVPWSKIAGMRNLVIHSYFRINLDYVWEVIKKDLPDLKEKIQKIKTDLGNVEKRI